MRRTGGLLGVISEPDLVCGLANRGAMLLEARVDQWVTENPTLIDAETAE